MKISLNLLPPIQKKVLRTKHIFRTILDQQFRSLLLMGIVLLCLFLINMTLRMDVKSIGETNRGLEESNSYKEVLDLHKLFKTTNQETKVYSEIQNSHIVWSGIFRMLSAYVPEDIVISSIVTENDTVDLMGSAASRISLVSFQEKLGGAMHDGKQCFLDIDIADQYLVKATDVDFVMTFRLNVVDCMKEKI